MKKYINLAIMLNLLSGKRYNAHELAKKYETSVKTIYRSIDSLLEAGMPIVSLSGKNGGYELIKQSQMDMSFLTTKEIALFMSFVKSAPASLFCGDDIALNDRLESMSKTLSSDIFKESSSFIIDTQSWGASSNLNSKVEQIKESISNQEQIEIVYSGETRIVEPYTLVYKVGSWYAYCYCLKRSSFRLFKISRIDSITCLGQKFERKNVDTLSRPWNKEFKENLETIEVCLKSPKSKIDEIKEWLEYSKVISQGDDFLISGKANYCAGLVHKIMELGSSVKIIKPTKLSMAVIDECRKIESVYN